MYATYPFILQVHFSPLLFPCLPLFLECKSHNTHLSFRSSQLKMQVNSSPFHSCQDKMDVAQFKQMVRMQSHLWSVNKTENYTTCLSHCNSLFTCISNSAIISQGGVASSISLSYFPQIINPGIYFLVLLIYPVSTLICFYTAQLIYLC